MKNVLVINQSAELYGADKALLELLENYPKGYNPIVVLHEKGPLTERINLLNIQIIETSVIKVKRGIITPFFFINLPFEIIRSFIRIKKQLNGKKIDFIHSNATSVFIGAFYSFYFRKPHIWHVHEIIENPKRLAFIYPRIVNFFSNTVIFNSKATSKHFISNYPKIKDKSCIIYNGQFRKLENSTPEQISFIKNNIFKINKKETIVIGLIGRISRLKGQKNLLDAFAIINKRYNNLHLVFVGSSPKGQENYTIDLENKIVSLGLNNCVIVPFQENIWPIYDSIDIVVVPSTEPESFGLVATEAMLSKKPVVATKLGGLKEIVEDGETGFLFENENIFQLVNYLEILILDKNKRIIMGEEGFKRVNTYFSTKNYTNNIDKIYSKY